MMSTRMFVACAVAATSGACGLQVPEKNMISPDYIVREGFRAKGSTKIRSFAISSAR